MLSSDRPCSQHYSTIVENEAIGVENVIPRIQWFFVPRSFGIVESRRETACMTYTGDDTSKYDAFGARIGNNRGATESFDDSST